MQPVFDFEQAPPISVPYRFFLTAPLFALASGLGLVWMGPEAFASRWSAGMLAVVHLFTLGFLFQTMGGALLQILPVAAGAEVSMPLGLARLAHPGIVFGTLSLAAGFASGQGVLFPIAMFILGAVLLGYSLMTGRALLRSQARGATIAALRLALLALLPTLVLGESLASIFGWQQDLPLMELVSLHAAWGLAGWGLLLVMGVGYLVVPMFQLTPPYQPRAAMVMPLVLFALLVLFSVLSGLGAAPGWRTLTVFLMAIPLGAFAIITLLLQSRRRRRLADVTLDFWRFGMVVLLAACVTVPVGMLLPASALTERLELLTGVLVLPGLFFSLISGMLYKIMPFLNWLHLQRIQVTPPNMKQMLSEQAMRRHFRLHMAAMVLLVLAVFVPELARPAGLLFGASALFLQWNLWCILRVYRLHAGSASSKPAIPIP